MKDKCIPKTGDNTFSGTLYQGTGPAFDTVPFDPNQIVPVAMGTGTLTFSDANNGSFAYTVKGISQTKAITREVFGPLPICTWGHERILRWRPTFRTCGGLRRRAPNLDAEST